MNKREKGNKYEREVELFLQKLGFITHRSRSSGFKVNNKYLARSNDIFGCFDIIAKKENYETVWIQVSTGSRFSEKRKKIETLGNIWNQNDKVLIWLRYKNKKWKVYDFLKNQELNLEDNYELG